MDNPYAMPVMLQTQLALKANDRSLITTLLINVEKPGRGTLDTSEIEAIVQIKVPPRFELGSQDSESWVLTVTPRNPLSEQVGVVWYSGWNLLISWQIAEKDKKQNMNLAVC